MTSPYLLRPVRSLDEALAARPRPIAHLERVVIPDGRRGVVTGSAEARPRELIVTLDTGGYVRLDERCVEREVAS